MELRNSGIKVVGEMPWGTHFCHFYSTNDDLLEALVPYFKVGLQSKEYCLWIISDPLTKEDAARWLRASIPELDQHLARRDIEIVSHQEWYLKGGAFDAKTIINNWYERLDRALLNGYVGMRVNGLETWITRNDWTYFYQYEKDLNRSLLNHRMIVVCTYPLSHSGAEAVLDVANTHQFVCAIRRGHWDIIETAELQQAKREIHKINLELEKQLIDSKRYIELLIQERSLRQQIESSLTHDIRNPLGAALMSAQLLIRRLPENPLVQTLTNRIVFAIQRSDALIQDLLDINKILSNTPIPFNLEDLDLCDILEKLVKRLNLKHEKQIILNCLHGIMGRWDQRTLIRALEVLLTFSTTFADVGTQIVVNIKKNDSVLTVIQFKGKAPWAADPDRWTLWWTLAHGIITQQGGKLRSEFTPDQDIQFYVELPKIANQSDTAA